MSAPHAFRGIHPVFAAVQADTGFRADFINLKGADALDLITDLYAAHTANAFIDIQFDRRIGMVHFAFGNKLSRVRRFLNAQITGQLQKLAVAVAAAGNTVHIVVCKNQSDLGSLHLFNLGGNGVHFHAVFKRCLAAGQRQFLTVCTFNTNDANGACARSMAKRFKSAKRRDKKSHLSCRFQDRDFLIKIKGFVVDIGSHLFSPLFLLSLLVKTGDRQLSHNTE